MASKREKRLNRRVGRLGRQHDPIYAPGTDVFDVGKIEAVPADTPMTAPEALLPPPPKPKPIDGSSLRGRVEGLMRTWEVERSLNIAAAEDSTLPPELRAAARRAADLAGLFIDDLDRMYSDYVQAIRP